MEFIHVGQHDIEHYTVWTVLLSEFVCAFAQKGRLQRLRAVSGQPIALDSVPLWKPGCIWNSMYIDDGSSEHLSRALPYVGIFDFIEVVNNPAMILIRGFVTREGLKIDAVKALEKLESRKPIVSELSMLPSIADDDRIRLAAKNAIQEQCPLSIPKSSPDKGIHIIVFHGRIQLWGTASLQEAELAENVCRQISGIHSVENLLNTKG